MKIFPFACLLATALLFSACTTGNQERPQVYKAKIGSTEVTSFSPIPAGATIVEPVTVADVEKFNQTSAEPAAPTTDPYALHHRAFPNLLFKTEGKFFASLHKADVAGIRDVVAKNYGEPYAKAMRFKSVSSPDIVFVTFAEPSRPPLCHHIAFIKTGDEYQCITLEKTEDILSAGHKTAFCGWTLDGKHLNFGPRTYTDLRTFEEEVVEFIRKKTTPQPNAITTPNS